MTTGKSFLQMLTILVALLTMAVPAYVAYDLYSKGPTPKKQIELHKMPFINPMNDLAALGNEAALSLSIRNQSTNNFIIAKEWIRNTGSAPILPSDYHEKITVNVQKPWKILEVGNSLDFPSAIAFKWKRINDTKFEAEPALLNPGDIVSTNIYLTYAELNKPSITGRSPTVITEWKARIVNMNDFTIVPYYLMEFSKPGSKGNISGIQVFLYGWSLVIVIVISSIFFALYLQLMNLAGLLQDMHIKSILLVVGASLLGFADAESTVYYIVPNDFIEASGINHIANAPWIILHLIFICYLYRKSQFRTP